MVRVRFGKWLAKLSRQAVRRRSRPRRRLRSLSGQAALLEDRTLLAAPVLIGDFNSETVNPDTAPDGFLTIGSQTYFFANNPLGGEWLCVTDGTAGKTRTIMGFASNVPNWPTNVNGTLFFTAYDGDGGTEIWKSDGTTAGTVLVADLEPGFEGAGPPSQGPGVHVIEAPTQLLSFQNMLYFVGDNGVSGAELWRSDGTAAGTMLVKDIRPGVDNADILSLRIFDGSLYFAADDGTRGRELWKSDGTEAGTALVKEFTDGPAGSGSIGLMDVDGTLFISASGTGIGAELWKSDGTTAGTVLVKDILPGSSGAGPFALVNHNGTLFFVANDANGRELWRSDGTSAGTVLVKDINPGSASSTPASLLSVGASLYFSAMDGASGRELWKTDGTSAGTVQVLDIRPGAGDSDSVPVGLTALGGTLYFQANDGVHGLELWKSDGTAGGTSLVADIRPGSASSDPVRLAVQNGKLYFNADDGVHGRELWTSDGTSSGTSQLVDLAPIRGLSSQLQVTGSVNGLTYFNRWTPETDYELWVTDGTAPGTMFLKDLSPTSESFPSSFINFKGATYFAVLNVSTGSSLWKTDGTPAGTQFVTSISSNTSNSPREFTVVGDQLFFVAVDNRGGELWVTDGTAAGTTTIEIASGGTGSYPGGLFEFNGTLLFQASDGTPGNGQGELWKSNGTAAGTALVKDIRPGAFGSGPRLFTNLNNSVYFFANDGTGPESLWKTDGTAAGTAKIGQTSVLGGVVQANMIQAGSRLFFQGIDDVHGREVWTSDGNSGSVQPVRDIIFGGMGSNPWNFIDINGTVYFVANDGATGRELWKLNPTTLETSVVKDIFPGLAGSHPTWLTNVAGTLYFVADDGVSGAEIWKSDGTAAGTARVTDLESTGSSSPKGLRFVDWKLLFTADTAATGRELWSLSINEPPTDIVLAPASITENSAPGTLVGVLTAFDPDAGETFTFSLVSGSGDGDNALFTIIGNNLFTTTSFDYEARTSLSIRVRATDQLGATFDKVVTISVTDVVELPVSPIVDVHGVPNQVVENAPTMATVGVTLFASDPDSGPAAVTYSLDDDAGGRFLIHPTLGGIFVANGAIIDRETAASYTIVARATSSDGSSSTGSFVIDVIDVNETSISAVSDTNAVADSILENSAPGTPVGITAFASDADATNSAITYSLTNSAAGRFAIDPLTGVVSVSDASLLNYEADASHTITVLAASQDGSTSSQSFVIQITDVNEHAVGAIQDTDAAPDHVLENAPNGTVVGVTAFASDADGTNNGVTYSLWSNANGRFAIDPITGVVTVAKSEWLDREAAARWAITVLATSQDGSVSAKWIPIDLIDVDEFNVGAISDAEPAANSVLENAPNGTVVGITARAFDSDMTNSAITYSLYSSANGRFAIHPVTGVVTVAKSEWLDREAAASWSITVLATSQDGSVSVKAVPINLVDVDEYDAGAISDADPAANSVLENAPNGTVVGLTARAFDQDKTNSGITYSLYSSANGRFAIDPATGVVTVAKSEWLDREAAASWSITVLATSQDGSTSVKAFAISLVDVDEYDVGPISDANPAGQVVAEGSANGTLVGLTARAFDSDATNSTVTYSLIDNAGGRFAINTLTGVVTVANTSLIDYETARFHVINVRATSSDDSTSSKAYVISVGNVLESVGG